MAKVYKTPFLSVYDGDGNKVPIPAIRGESAYENAVRNGYTGTEDEFGKLQADSGTNAKIAEDSANRASESAAEAVGSQSAAMNSETSAAASATTASQAMSDLLNMLGTDVATLVGGKIPLDQIPATATQEIHEVSDESALTTLTAQRGDLAELITEVNGERTITKTWQCLGDSTVRSNWVVWGTAYAVQAGSSSTAKNAENASMINNHRMVEMDKAQFDAAVKDPSTYYLVYDSKAEV